jgi:hypothetical protein
MEVSLNRFRATVCGLAALLCSCASAGAAPTASEAATPRPAMWKLADEDTTIYLFGTIHLLPEGTVWRTPVLDQALAQSDTLAVEVLLPEDPMETAQLLNKLGMSPGLPPLKERVPADKQDELDALIGSTGVPSQMLDAMETWYAGLTLTSIALLQLGFDPKLGVEAKLRENAGGVEKSVVALETAEEQFGFFDRLSEQSQRMFLVGSLTGPTEMRKQFEAMLAAWLRGDVDNIARTFNNEESLSKELREALLLRRNAAWAHWLEQRLKQPGTVFVAVGAGHLAGSDSVQEILKAKGLPTTRVQ